MEPNRLYWLLPVCLWLDSLIGPGELLLVVSHLFGVPTLVLWVVLEKKVNRVAMPITKHSLVIDWGKSCDLGNSSIHLFYTGWCAFCTPWLNVLCGNFMSNFFSLLNISANSSVFSHGINLEHLSAVCITILN